MKTQGDLKDFGTTIAIWSEGFLNYVVIINELFGPEHLGLVSVTHRSLVRAACT
jgi:hypothetical protein